MRDWYCTREWQTFWRARAEEEVLGSRGLVPEQVKSIFLTSSSTTAPLSLDTHCWLSRVCCCPPPLKQVPGLQPYYKSLPKDLVFTRNFCTHNSLKLFGQCVSRKCLKKNQVKPQISCFWKCDEWNRPLQGSSKLSVVAGSIKKKMVLHNLFLLSFKTCHQLICTVL